MAVVLGTSAGFVTTAPTANPEGSKHGTDSSARATKDTCPVQTKVTEMGFYVDGSHTAGNFEVGIYSHDAGSDTADALLFSDTVNTTSGSTGWQVVTGLDWVLTEGVIYWTGLQVDAVAGTTNIDYNPTGGRSGINVSEASLPDPFNSISDGGTIESIYAKVEVATTFSELSGTIAAVSVVENADLNLITWSNLSGTIAAQSAVSGNLGFVLVNVGDAIASKRVVAIGNNQFWYEDI